MKKANAVDLRGVCVGPEIDEYVLSQMMEKVSGAIGTAVGTWRMKDTPNVRFRHPNVRSATLLSIEYVDEIPVEMSCKYDS